MFEFSGFIKEVASIDMSIMGNKFTWFSLNDKAMSQLDKLFYDKV